MIFWSLNVFMNVLPWSNMKPLRNTCSNYVWIERFAVQTRVVLTNFHKAFCMIIYLNALIKYFSVFIALIINFWNLPIYIKMCVCMRKWLAQTVMRVWGEDYLMLKSILALIIWKSKIMNLKRTLKLWKIALNNSYKNKEGFMMK